jgi:hypothetical protein
VTSLAIFPLRRLGEESTTPDHVETTSNGDGGVPSKGLLSASRRQVLAGAGAYNPTVIEDLLFLDAWEKGQVPTLSAFFRARQIRRADPVNAVEDRKPHAPSSH